MKKLLLILCILAIAISSYAGNVTDAKKAVIARKNAAAPASYPVIAYHAESNATGTTHLVDLPDTIGPGNTLICFFGLDDTDQGTATVSWPGSWAELSDSVGGSSYYDVMSIAWLKAVGDEDGSQITVTTTGSGGASSSICVAITGAADPAVNPPEAGTQTDGNSGSPDPPSLTAGGGSDNYLWIASYVQDRYTAPSSYPYPDDNIYHVSGGGGGDVLTAICSDGVTAETQDPSAFTAGVSRVWLSNTVVVYPQ